MDRAVAMFETFYDSRTCQMLHPNIPANVEIAVTGVL